MDELQPMSKSPDDRKNCPNRRDRAARIRSRYRPAPRARARRGARAALGPVAPLRRPGRGAGAHAFRMARRARLSHSTSGFLARHRQCGCSRGKTLCSRWGLGARDVLRRRAPFVGARARVDAVSKRVQKAVRHGDQSRPRRCRHAEWIRLPRHTGSRSRGWSAAQFPKREYERSTLCGKVEIVRGCKQVSSQFAGLRGAVQGLRLDTTPADTRPPQSGCRSWRHQPGRQCRSHRPRCRRPLPKRHCSTRRSLQPQSWSRLFRH